MVVYLPFKSKKEISAKIEKKLNIYLYFCNCKTDIVKSVYITSSLKGFLKTMLMNCYISAQVDSIICCVAQRLAGAAVGLKFLVYCSLYPCIRATPRPGW